MAQSGQAGIKGASYPVTKQFRTPGPLRRKTLYGHKRWHSSRNLSQREISLVRAGKGRAARRRSRMHKLRLGLPMLYMGEAFESANWSCFTQVRTLAEGGTLWWGNPDRVSCKLLL